MHRTSPRTSSAPTKPSKTCPRCGRSFSWRKKWASNWPEIIYCSQRCRQNRLKDVDHHLEASILELLAARTGTICPSEAARSTFDQTGRLGQQWRDLMEPTRAAARRLVAEEAVEILQRGRRVEPATARGAIRIGRGRRFEAVRAARKRSCPEAAKPTSQQKLEEDLSEP